MSVCFLSLISNIFVSVFSLFNIVKFKNDVCTASNGNLGTCYTEAECTKFGGTNGGSCASTFGVCCTGKEWFAKGVWQLAR